MTSKSHLPVKQECAVPGKHLWLIWQTPFLIDERYTPIKAVGKGAYGVVCSARDSHTGNKVAIKKITKAFESVHDARRALREMLLLRHLRHENIIAVLDVMRPPSPKTFDDLYLVYELMDTDLDQIIRSSQPLTDDHFQFFIYQLLRGLKYVHTASVLHRDLKPSNLLLNASCDLKICDFGLARTSICHKGSEETSMMTEYVVTRWYRAPELLIASNQYTAAIDMWSVGCILAELLQRKPLFAGKDYIHQLRMIIRLLGTPSDADLAFVASDKARAYIRALEFAKRADFRAHFPGANPLALDMLDRLLVLDPSKRLTVHQALAHPYLAALHDAASEPAAAGEFVFDQEVENTTDVATLRALVCAEIDLYTKRGKEGDRGGPAVQIAVTAR